MAHVQTERTRQFQRLTSWMVIIFWMFHSRNYHAVDHGNTACLSIALTATTVKQRAFTTTELQHIARCTHTVVHIQSIEKLCTGKCQLPNQWFFRKCRPLMSTHYCCMVLLFHNDHWTRLCASNNRKRVNKHSVFGTGLLVNQL